MAGQLNGGKMNQEGQATEAYDETTIHKTILVGDSGVGKTSLLVQFDQGKFQVGSFSATVGIGFTVEVVCTKQNVFVLAGVVSLPPDITERLLKYDVKLPTQNINIFESEYRLGQYIMEHLTYEL